MSNIDAGGDGVIVTLADTTISVSDTTTAAANNHERDGHERDVVVSEPVAASSPTVAAAAPAGIFAAGRIGNGAPPGVGKD